MELKAINQSLLRSLLFIAFDICHLYLRVLELIDAYFTLITFCFFILIYRMINKIPFIKSVHVNNKVFCSS